MLLDCGPRLRAGITRRLRARGHEVGDASLLDDESADLSSVCTVIVSLDLERSRSGLPLLTAARRRLPDAQRILIAPRTSQIVRPAMLAGLVDRAWLAPIGSRLIGLLDSIRPIARTSNAADVAARRTA